MRAVKVHYSRRARRQLDNIHTYIHARNPEAATRVVARIRRSVSLLLDFPQLGPHGLIAGTRELVVVGLPYIAVYRIVDGRNDVVEILGVYHSAQDRVRDLE